MSSCVNINDKDFHNLMIESGETNPLTLAAKIQIWQKNNNTDMWPRVEQLYPVPDSFSYDYDIYSVEVSKTEDGWIGNAWEYKGESYEKKVIDNEKMTNVDVLEDWKSKEGWNKRILSRSRLNSKKVEQAYEKFFGKQDFYNRERTSDDYVKEIDEERTDFAFTLQDKIDRMQKAFDATVMIDNNMEESGMLLAANHPLTRRNGKPTIVINPNKAFADTVFHEFGHLYIDLLGGMSDPKVVEAVEFLKGTSLWFKVQDAYPSLSGEALAKEVVATALGVEGDILYRENPTKRSIWQRIRAALLQAVSKLLGKTPNALTQLATEMLHNQTRVRPGTSFNTLVDQASKLRIEGDVTQAKIDNLFKTLTDEFTLQEEEGKERGYLNKDGDFFSNSVSSFANSLKRNYYGDVKGDMTLAFDDAFKLTESNLDTIINSMRIPEALDRALNDFFDGTIQSELLIAKGDENWFTFYNNTLNNEESLVSGTDVTEALINNLDAINEAAVEHQKELDLPIQAGNIIHKALEAFIKDDVPLPENIIDSRDKLVNAITKIIKEGKAKGSKFYTEQMLFSEMTNLPGTADLIEITKDGKFRIYDFKTKTTFYNRAGRRMSHNQMYGKYVPQILVYSNILREYGLEPADNHINIVAIEVDKDDMVHNDPSSTVKVTGVLVGNLLELAKEDIALSNTIKRTNNKVVSQFRRPTKLDKEEEVLQEIEEIDELVNKLARAAQDYTKEFVDLPESSVIREMEKDINKVMGKKNKQVILIYIQNIREALTKVYGNSMRNEDFLSTNYLKNLDYLIQVSSFLPDIRAFLQDQASDFHIEEYEIQDLLGLLNNTEKVLDDVLKFQDYKTKEKAVEVIVNNSNFMRGLHAERFELEGRALGKTKADLKEHIQQRLREESDQIQAKEYRYWTSIFRNGYTDIRYLEYLLADPGMNKSQIVQVVKNVMDKGDMDVRIDLDNSMVDLVQWYNKTKGFTGDPEKTWGKLVNEAYYYDFKGKKHTYKHASLITKQTSDYLEAHMQFKAQKEYYKRMLDKAAKENNSKLYEKALSKMEELKEKSKDFLKRADTKLRPNPKYTALDQNQKDALEYIYDKIDKADERLQNSIFSKLSYEVKGGAKVYQLPKKRKSALEAAYDAQGALKRFKSGLMDYLRPPADEDDISMTREERLQQNEELKTSSTDIMGNPKYDIPIYYRQELEDPTLQSFDIPTLLAMNEETTIQYEHYSAIEADLFVITNSLKNTKANKTDAAVNKTIVDRTKAGLEKKLNSPANLVLSSVQASIDNRLYKRTYRGVYSKLNYRMIKGAEALNKYTSMVLLAGNFGSGSMTALQGSIYRFIEGFAGEDFTQKNVRAGSRKAWADVPGMLADTQKHFPTSLTSLLIRRYGLETQYKALVNKFVQDNFATKNLDEGTIYAITSIAETIVTASLMYTMMDNIKVMNSKGDFIDVNGKKVSRENAMSLDEAYTVKDGKLILNKHVKFTEHNLTEPLVDTLSGEKTFAATELSNFMRSKYADLYGQYNQDMKSVAEMHVVGKLAFSMKKWIPRGYHRRWRGVTSVWNTFEEMHLEDNLDKRFYSQDQRKFQEGYYTTGLRFAYTMIQQIRDTKVGFATAFKNSKNQMTTHERANIKRMAMELAIMLTSFAAALALRAIALDLDDEDRNSDKIFLAAYLAERIKTESATFINPSELINMIKNPAAAVNTLDNMGKLLWQLFGISYDKEIGEFDLEFNNRYERGARAGELKLQKRFETLVPFYKKGSQFMGILGFDSKESISESFNYMIR